MINIYTAILILFGHFVGDFLFQTDEMAIKKSYSNEMLTLHVVTYFLGLVMVSVFIFPLTTAIAWAFINSVIHWAQDYITSRINSSLYKAEKRHWFFVGIGADQFIHACFLLSSYQLNL